MTKIFLTTLSVLLISSIMLAQAKAPAGKSNVHRYGGIACGSDPILPTDGSSADDYVLPGGSIWYFVHLKAGRSYSVDVWDSGDSAINGSAAVVLVASDCKTTINTTDQTSVDPDLSNNFGARISWIQSSDATAYLQVSTTDPSGNAYTIRITDTTLVNPRWSTYSGFATQYAFINNASVPVNGTLTVYDHSGAVLQTLPITVPATGENFSGVSAGPDHYGFSTFAFVGPPGVITADAYFINGSATVIVPSSFGPRNFQH